MHLKNIILYSIHNTKYLTSIDIGRHIKIIKIITIIVLLPNIQYYLLHLTSKAVIRQLLPIT